MSLRFDFVSGRLHRLPHRPLSRHTHIRVALQVNNLFLKKNTVESATLCFPLPLVSFQHLQTHTFFPPSLAALFSLTRTKKESLDKKRVFLMQASWRLLSFLPWYHRRQRKAKAREGGLEGGGRGQPPTPICNAFFG